jgi:hypothetical protein
MTDRQLADQAWAELTKTTDSYPTWVRKGKPAASHWAKAKAFLDQIDVAPPPPPVTSAVFVSPTGNDTSGDGSELKPFKTLFAAQAAMRGGGPQTCLVRGGVQPLASSKSIRNPSGTDVQHGLYLSAADSGQTYKNYPGDKPAFDASALHIGLLSDGASDITFDGLEVFGSKWVGIGVHGGEHFYEVYPMTTGAAARNTIRNCPVHDTSADISPIFGYGAAPIFCIGRMPGLTVEHNPVWNAATAGIHTNAGNSGHHCLDDLLVQLNAVHNVCTKRQDAAGIYAQDIYTDSTNLRWLSNFVRDAGHASAGGCLGFDDGLSNATVAGNVFTGLYDLACAAHGGRNIKYRGNLVDGCAASTNGPVILRYQGSSGVVTDHSGVEWTNNIVVVKNASLRYWNDFPVLIRDNLYWRYGTGQIQHGQDVAPVTADPLLRDPLYTLDPASPALQAPVSFPALKRDWGPPGYVIPSGTAPSYA